jgi:hypothetical protein
MTEFRVWCFLTDPSLTAAVYVQVCTSIFDAGKHTGHAPRCLIVKLEVVLACVFESVTGEVSIAENDGLDP